MTRRDPEVTFSDEDLARLPDVVVQGALSLMVLAGTDELTKVGEALKIRRSGGFAGIDLWVMLWLYFASGSHMGFKAFWRLIRPHSAQLGAMAGRSRLASTSSVSRGLSAVELKLLRPIGDDLLLLPGDMDKLLRHPAMQTYDTHGDGWHVFDLDPTVTTLRHRALPVSDELPEPRRTSENTGRPGYSGRKRGDIQFRRITVQHAGSSLWTHGHLSPGGGSAREDFGLALDSVVGVAKRLEVSLDRVLLRMDGEHGSVPRYTACREKGIPFITRLNRPALLSSPEILDRLRRATFYVVEDSGGGPQRAAAELGELTIAAGKETLRDDGTPYEPVTVRVVASMFPKSRPAKRGVNLDGWQVELFAVDVPADRWPAPEAITAYFGRTGQENRFAQEDRELGLDRIVSYHLPGQELATLVALSLWNHDVVRGFECNPPPEQAPVQQLREAKVDERVPALWPRDPVLVSHLGKVEWPALLKEKKEKWRFDDKTGALVCSDRRPLTLTTVRDRGDDTGKVGLIFCRSAGGCQDCDDRPACLRSKNPKVAKHAEFTVSSELAAPIQTRLTEQRRLAAAPARTATGAPPGPRAVRDALFLPARARGQYRALFLGSTVTVELDDRTTLKPTHLSLVAADTAERQRRRKTWAQNTARYALAESVTLSVHVAGAQGLRRLLGEDEVTEEKVGGVV